MRTALAVGLLAATAASAAPIASGDLTATLPGRWVGKEKGDAIPDGPFGGKIVDGGARIVFVHGKPGSKTPWNLTAWLPKEGHKSATTISIGCGFYDEVHESEGENGGYRNAYCRGYGLAKMEQLPLYLELDGAELRVRIGRGAPLVDVVVVRP